MKNGNDQLRELSEAEARAACVAFWLAATDARKTVASWLLRGKKKPSYEEMFQLCSWLLRTEQTAIDLGHQPDEDPEAFEGLIAYFRRHTATLDGQTGEK